MHRPWASRQGRQRLHQGLCPCLFGSQYPPLSKGGNTTSLACLKGHCPMRNLIADLGRFREGWDLAAQSDRASLRCRLWLLTMIPDPSWTSWMRLPREDPGSCICLYLLGALDPYTRLCAPALQPSVSSGSLQFLISLEPISQDLFILKVCPRLNLLWGAFPYAPPIPRVRLFVHWLSSEPCSGFFGNKSAIDCSCCGSWTLRCSYFFRF